MKKSSIERVASLAKSRESRTAKKLAEMLAKQKQAADQCNQIKGYRNEYKTHLDGLTKDGIDSRTLSGYRQFLGDLEDAIDQQNGAVKVAEQQVGETRSEWLSHYHRKTSLDQLVELQSEKKKEAEEKKLQKEVDERNGKNRQPGN